ncbi:hypothetical protein JHK87_033194 [Glycine soja]|nr:hypothetical protein JHK87_033194 [Glycine soja]
MTANPQHTCLEQHYGEIESRFWDEFEPELRRRWSLYDAKGSRHRVIGTRKVTVPKERDKLQIVTTNKHENLDYGGLMPTMPITTHYRNYDDQVNASSMDILVHVRCTCTLYIAGMPCLKLFIGCGTAHRRVKVGYAFVNNIRIIHPGVPAILTGAQSNYPDQNAHYGLLGSKNDVDCKCHTHANNERFKQSSQGAKKLANILVVPGSCKEWACSSMKLETVSLQKHGWESDKGTLCPSWASKIESSKGYLQRISTNYEVE